MTDQPEVKFLDLDSLASDIAVTILINGNKHEMAEMTVADFVWAQKVAGEQEKLDADNLKEEDYTRIMGRMIDMLDRQFPSCPREEIAALSITKLTALIKFTGQLGAEGATAAIEEAAEEGNVVLVETEEKPTDQ